MNIQHTYIVNKLIRKKQEGDLQDVVTEINYTLKTLDLDTPTGEYDTITDRTIELELPTENNENFIAYEDLTEEIVISWISGKSKDLELFHEKIMNDLDEETIS